jgi:hypothetical protein
MISAIPLKTQSCARYDWGASDSIVSVPDAGFGAAVSAGPDSDGDAGLADSPDPVSEVGVEGVESAVDVSVDRLES